MMMDSINYKEDFFGKSTNLTVSGQLEGELGAMAFGEMYILLVQLLEQKILIQLATLLSFG